MSGAGRIGFLGLGEVGQILAGSLPVTDLPNLAFDTKFGDPSSGPSKFVSDSVKVERSPSPTKLGRQSQIIFSAVTAENAEAAAKTVTQNLPPMSWFIDLNSASPQTKQRTATLINQAGGRYVEAAVMSPVPPKGLAAPILLGGPYAKAVEPIISGLGFSNTEVFSESYGSASAAKMCRSVMIKGMEALLLESLVSARTYGVEQTVLDSLTNLFPGPDWPELSKYMIGRALVHGERRAEEMREVAKTVSNAALSPTMSLATVELQTWAKQFGEFDNLDSLGAVLDALSAAAKEIKRGNAA